MNNFDYHYRLWESCVTSIKYVSIGDGVTPIGQDTLCLCDNLASATLVIGYAI